MKWLLDTSVCIPLMNRNEFGRVPRLGIERG